MSNEIVERLWLDTAEARRPAHPQAAIRRLERNVDSFGHGGRGFNQLLCPSSPLGQNLCKVDICYVCGTRQMQIAGNPLLADD